MIELSVALPVYRGKDSVWLAMEGLCRQRGIDFEWELLIAEEDDGALGKQGFLDNYRQRLRAVGCMEIVYLKLAEWRPLAAKWGLLFDNVSESSLGVALQAADNYPQPYRLKETRAALASGADWVQRPRGRFYNIRSGRSAIFDVKNNIYYHPTGLDTAIARRKLDLVERQASIRKGVDSWLYMQVQPVDVVFINNDNWEYGLWTDGVNNLSLRRGQMIDNRVAPFERDTGGLGRLPEEIVKRMKSQGSRPIPRENRRNTVTIGIVVTREEMYMRAVQSAQRLASECGVEVRVYDNRDKAESIGRCFNQIAQESTTDLVGYLGDDDWVMPGYVQALQHAMRQAEEAGDEPAGAASYLTIVQAKGYMQKQILSPGIWKRTELMREPFDEDLDRYVTAEHFGRMSDRGKLIALASWYYGYMYFQHGGNVSKKEPQGNSLREYNGTKKKKN